MKVILYSIGCPKCKILEKKMEMKHIDYALVESVDIMQKMGFSEAPILEVDGELMPFVNAIKWVNGR